VEFINPVVLKGVPISSIPNINDIKRIDSIKITTIPKIFKPIPALIKSDILTLFVDNIIAFGGVAIT
jgi:hypothetical protein